MIILRAVHGPNAVLPDWAVDALIARATNAPMLRLTEPEFLDARLGEVKTPTTLIWGEHDGVIFGCAALYPFPDRKTAELAALAVNPFYRDGGRGERLLEYAEARARSAGLKSLFVLSTRTTHWFLERGFAETDPGRLPERKHALYNYDRRSKVFTKEL